jgi:hypothetical protein
VSEVVTEVDVLAAREWRRREAEIEPYEGQEERLAALLAHTRGEALRDARAWGVYVVTGPSADTWCQHTEGHRIEVDKRTARTIALLFQERFHHDFVYEARPLPAPDGTPAGGPGEKP